MKLFFLGAAAKCSQMKTNVHTLDVPFIYLFRMPGHLLVFGVLSTVKLQQIK